MINLISPQLKTILYKYASARGLGIPLTAEQMLNAFSFWLLDVLPENIQVNAVLGSETKAELTGKGLPEDPYILTITLDKNALSVSGGGSAKPIESISTTINSVEKSDETTFVFGGTQTITYEDQSVEVIPFTNSLPIEAGEGLIVDTNEDQDGLEAHIDSEITQKLARCLLTPMSAPLERSFVAVDTNNAQVLIPESQVGGFKLFTHNFTDIIGGGQQSPVVTISNVHGFSTNISGTSLSIVNNIFVRTFQYPENKSFKIYTSSPINTINIQIDSDAYPVIKYNKTFRNVKYIECLMSGENCVGACVINIYCEGEVQ